MDISENDISKIVYEAGYIVHKTLGPGLLESAYEECLFYELNKYNLLVERQKPMPLVYDDVKMDVGYRLDFLIEKKFVLEIKSIESLQDIHLAQILTYLRLSNCKLGMLINFNTLQFKNGVKRVINGIL
ncbi:GxxExxY protein [Chryseobacterium culicis]|uniref:Fe3+ hydroxamate ABC transporter substrate-binding protein n=1 Tax=Chryseobacterium culicis TaxID=680127 RepID=A0A2S9CL66_CHRCI|nr:GxxExxY protein [Chryseobacterium culicis]PRB81262.1 Fe3+ hydroxamate ABC transporter substrate-binding protein [Chryseobacterium culicis]PRB88199.1 Fe3+ hydroxamate ABC transporter substrate-binding protein [Chryseobacterium culicis]